MKQLLPLLLLCYLCNATYAQQTYIRNYSTFTEYGTIPAATVPSSYSTNYNYNPQPAYEYKAPEKTEEDIAKEAWREDLYATKEQLNLYYSKKDYNSVITICKAYEERYPDKSVYPDIEVYLASAYLHTKQFDILAERLSTKSVYYSDRQDFNLAAADLLQQYGNYERAYWYYKLVKKSTHKFDGYELGYSVTAARQGEEWVAEDVFSSLMRATNDNPNNYYNRALAFLNVKNPARELALKDLVIFTTKATETYDAYLLMAKIYAAKENWEECIASAKAYLKLKESKECAELITKAEAEIADRPRKAALALAEEQQRKEAAAIIEQQQKEQKIKDDAATVIRQNDKLEAFKKLEDEYMEYAQQHGIHAKRNTDNSTTLENTYLEQAIKRHDLKSVFILIKQSKPNSYSGSPLYIAIEERAYSVAEFLIENNINLNMTAQGGMTALHFVCAEYLIDYNTPPENTVTRGNVKIAKMLIDKGFDVNAIDKNRYTPLHYAASSGNLAMVKMLLEHDVKPFSKVWPYADTPLDCVMRSKEKNKEIIKLLKAYDPQ